MMKNLSKNLIFAIFIFFLVTVLFSFLIDSKPEKPEVISISGLVERINAGDVKTIIVSGEDLKISFIDSSEATARKEAGTAITDTLKNYSVDKEKLNAIDLNVKEPGGLKYWMSILLPVLLPVILILIIILFMFRKAKSGVNQAFTFGKANLRLSTPSKNKVMFKDVAGLKESKEELEEIVNFLKNPKKFLDMGAKIPRGVLLMGAPGTGKTLLARAVSGESGVPFFHLSASEFVEMFVGVGASVKGDEPVLVRENGNVKLLPIKEVIDRYYREGESGFAIPINNLEVLGMKKERTKFHGFKDENSKKFYFGGSRFVRPEKVYRHKAEKIYEVRYRGGIIETTGDHSVFVREKNYVTSKRVDELEAGDTLVNLPFKVRGVFVPGVGTMHKVKAHDFEENKIKTLKVWEEDRELLDKYKFVLENRNIIPQYEIASHAGVSKTTIKNWQQGIHMPQGISLASSPSKENVPKLVNITEDLMRLLGYYTAEGRITNYYTQFVFGAHEKDLQKDCISLIKNIFKLDPHIFYTKDNSIRITCFSKVVADFFEKHCGNGSYNKHVPSFAWHIPWNLTSEYIKGYGVGDGYEGKDGKLVISSVSKQLIYELVWLLSMHGIQVGMHRAVSPGGRIIKNRPLPESVHWKIIIGKTSNFWSENEVKSKYQFKKPKVLEVIEKKHDGYVYDFCGCEGEAFFAGRKPTLVHNSRVRDLFQVAKKSAPSIVFIDEIDAVGRERGTGVGGGHDEREQTLNQILVEMDGFEKDSNVIVIAATNRPDVLDKALLRPGRFDRRVVLDMPDIKDREEILKIHSRGKPFAKDVDLKMVAIRTPGFSGADLENILNESALLAAGKDRKEIIQEDVLDSIEKVLLGPARKSRVISEREKKITAYHEAGHALVAASLKESDPVHKVTIISRGLAGGYTLKLPMEESRIKTKSQFLSDIAVSFGGYAAESILFKDISTGSSSDLRYATDMARRLITQYGMAEKLGPRTFGKTQELVFLGREITTEKDYSEKVAIMIDEEMNKFIKTALDTAKKIIIKHRKALDRIAKTLMEKETIEHEEFYKLVKDFGIKQISLA